MKNELNSIHDWDLHRSINAAKVERNNNTINLISEYLDIPFDFVAPKSNLFILGIMASILHEEGLFFENITVENRNSFIIPEGLFIKYNLKDEVKEKIIALLKLDELYQKNKTRATYKALFLNYNIKEIEAHIIGLIQKINENSAEINLFDLGNIVDISIEDFLEQ